MVSYPSELGDIEQAEAYQISLLGGAAGEQIIQQQHGWWNEQEQHTELLAPTLRTEPLPFGEAREIYHQQILIRVQLGFVHSRSFSFSEGELVYRDLTGFNLKTAGQHLID